LFFRLLVAVDAAVFERARDAWQKHVRPYVQNPYLSDPDRFTREPGFRDHIFLDAARFASFLTEPVQEPFVERRFVDGLLRNRTLNEMFHEAVPPILHEDDLNSMYFSIENRSPMLDRTLFEYCHQIPVRHLIRDAFGKAVLRDAMRGIVPARILENRRKIGFNAPITSYLDVHNDDVRSAILADSPVFELVRRGCIENLLNKGILPNHESKFLFSFVSAKMFLEEFGA
jgi:asparagine synthase (glutamine-hydrolysing)